MEFPVLQYELQIPSKSSLPAALTLLQQHRQCKNCHLLPSSPTKKRKKDLPTFTILFFRRKKSAILKNKRPPNLLRFNRKLIYQNNLQTLMILFFAEKRPSVKKEEKEKIFWSCWLTNLIKWIDEKKKRRKKKRR